MRALAHYGNDIITLNTMSEVTSSERYSPRGQWSIMKGLQSRSIALIFDKKKDMAGNESGGRGET